MVNYNLKNKTGIINIYYMDRVLPCGVFQGYRFAKMINGVRYTSKYTKTLEEAVKFKIEFYKEHNLEYK